MIHEGRDAREDARAAALTSPVEGDADAAALDDRLEDRDDDEEADEVTDEENDDRRARVAGAHHRAIHDDDLEDSEDEPEEGEDEENDDDDGEGDDDGDTARQPALLPIVAIVGRPNVGKSTLFNRLVGRRAAIVEDRPGVTRDRHYAEGEWEGRRYIVVDTGGIDPDLDTGLWSYVRAQAEMAVTEADLVLFVVDAVDGVTADDREIAALLRTRGKPLLVVANKCDNPVRELAASAAYELGLGEVHPVSAAHGRGVGDFLDALIEVLPEGSYASTVAGEGIRIAFVGRPNAGKSTIINALLASERVIVDDRPGTTHDSIDSALHWRGHDLVVIDTAGLRRRKQIDRAMEKLAAIKTIRTIERAEVIVLVLDADAGVTDQDQRIARMAFERGKGVVVALHKWDTLAGDARRTHAVVDQVERDLGFLERPWCVKTSIVGPDRDRGRGRSVNLDAVLEAAVKTAVARQRRIPTSALNEELQRAVAEHNPPAHRHRTVKLYFATQAERAPPLLVVSANMGRCLDPAWERYFVRRVRKRWGLRGVPIRIVVRARGRGNQERGAADETG